MRVTSCTALVTAFLAATAARADAPGADPRSPDNHAVERFRGEIGAAPLLAPGLTPGLGSGVSFFTGFRWTSLSVILEGRLFTSSDEQIAENVLIDSSIAMPTLAVCGHRAALSACGVVDIGELRTETGDHFRIESHNPWGASVGVRTGAELPLWEHVMLRGFAELHAQFGRPSVWVNNAEAWRAPLLFGVFGVGLTFPLGTL